MGGIAAADRGCGSAGEAERPGQARAFPRAATEPLLASWQTLAGLAWLAGRITCVLGRYYVGAAMARLADQRLPVRRAGR